MINKSIFFYCENKSIQFVSEKKKEEKQNSSLTDSNETSESNSSSYDSNTSNSSLYDSDGFRTDKDIYRTANTEDGMEKAYKSINNEMDNLHRNMRGGKINKREVLTRINFLLNGIKILDKKNKK